MSMLQPTQSGEMNSTTLDAADEMSADVGAVLQESQVMEVLQKLDQELVGLKSVKTRIREIAALLLIDRMRRSLGLTAHPPSLHMSFTGRQGQARQRWRCGWQPSCID